MGRLHVQGHLGVRLRRRAVLGLTVDGVGRDGHADRPVTVKGYKH